MKEFLKDLRMEDVCPSRGPNFGFLEPEPIQIVVFCGNPDLIGCLWNEWGVYTCSQPWKSYGSIYDRGKYDSNINTGKYYVKNGLKSALDCSNISVIWISTALLLFNDNYLFLIYQI